MLRLLLVAALIALVPATAAQATAVTFFESPPEDSPLDSDWADRSLHLAVEARDPGPHPATLYMTRIEGGQVILSRQVSTVAYGHPDPTQLVATGGSELDKWDEYLAARRVLRRHIRGLYPILGRSPAITYDGQVLTNERQARMAVPDVQLMVRIAESLAADHLASGEPLIVMVAGVPEQEVRAHGAVVLLRKRSTP